MNLTNLSEVAGLNFVYIFILFGSDNTTASLQV